MNRAIPLFLLAVASGCFPTYKHSVIDVTKAPLAAENGDLAVVTTDGHVIHYQAPYSVQPIPGGIEVRSKLLPSVEYEAAEVDRIEASQFRGGATVLAVAVGVTATYVAVCVGVLAAVAASGPLLRTGPFF